MSPRTLEGHGDAHRPDRTPVRGLDGRPRPRVRNHCLTTAAFVATGYGRLLGPELDRRAEQHRLLRRVPGPAPRAGPEPVTTRARRGERGRARALGAVQGEIPAARNHERTLRDKSTDSDAQRAVPPAGERAPPDVSDRCEQRTRRSPHVHFGRPGGRREALALRGRVCARCGNGACLRRVRAGEAVIRIGRVSTVRQGVERRSDGSGADDGTASTWTRTSTAHAPCGEAMSGLISISTISWCGSASALRRRRTSSMAATSQRPAPDRVRAHKQGAGPASGRHGRDRGQGRARCSRPRGGSVAC